MNARNVHKRAGPFCVLYFIKEVVDFIKTLHVVTNGRK